MREMIEKKTFCRICEPMCRLDVVMEDGVPETKAYRVREM